MILSQLNILLKFVQVMSGVHVLCHSCLPLITFNGSRQFLGTSCKCQQPLASCGEWIVPLCSFVFLGRLWSSALWTWHSILKSVPIFQSNGISNYIDFWLGQSGGCGGWEPDRLTNHCKHQQILLKVTYFSPQNSKSLDFKYWDNPTE